MEMVFDAMSVHEIVIEGVEPSANATSSELQGYQVLSKHGLPILIQVISKLILKKVSKYRSPHAIWRYLKETYYRDTAFSFVLQVAGLCLLSSKYEKGKLVSEFMDKFEEQWSRLYEVTTGSDPYRQKFRAFLEENYAKRDFLLAALSEYYPNPVDNLTTKVDPTYAEARHHLISLYSNNQLGMQVLVLPLPLHLTQPLLPEITSKLVGGHGGNQKDQSTTLVNHPQMPKSARIANLTAVLQKDISGKPAGSSSVTKSASKMQLPMTNKTPPLPSGLVARSLVTSQTTVPNTSLSPMDIDLPDNELT